MFCIGGADSDDMLHLVRYLDPDEKVDYVWFNTGLEYQATKDQLDYLEQRYQIKIKRERPEVPIPRAVREHGMPFMNKQLSQHIYRLQKHDFDFSKGGRSFEELYAEYPRCKSALRWWCNTWDVDKNNIQHNTWMKEFLIANPPDFAISDKCCKYAKKDVIARIIKEGNYQLNLFGVRKFEGGQRANAYKSCFNEDSYKGCPEYLPLFWWTADDKKQFEECCNIRHSKCYTEYGLKRTGCAACPFSKNLWKELEVIEEYEPKLYTAVWNVFGRAYEYTQEYEAFKLAMNNIHGSYAAYMRKKEVNGSDLLDKQIDE